MGSFVAEAGTDVSLGGEKVKSSGVENNCNEIYLNTEAEQGVQSPSTQDGKNPNGLASLRSGDVLKVDENQDPLNNKPEEPDYLQKCNGNTDAQSCENGDGDLPSFSIRRLRRLPHRVSSDQQPSALASRAVITHSDENFEQRKSLPDASAVDVAHSSGGDSTGQSSFVSNRSMEDVEAASERSSNIPEEATNQGVQNGETECRKSELENRNFAIEEPHEPALGSAQAAEAPFEREEQAGNVLDQGIREEKKQGFAGSEHALEHTSAVEGEAGNILHQSDESNISSPKLEAAQVVDHRVQEKVSPQTSDLSSAEIGAVSHEENVQVASPAPVLEAPNADLDGKFREDVNSVAPAKPVEELVPSSPGIVQILPPVLGSRFGSPGETTTDEETDSPRSSGGFSYPGDADPMAQMSYSGQIMYPSRFSVAQSSNGPSLLQYSGSMSLRSDSSTTSNRSFAFPILAPPEWNSSPARMAKAHPRRKNRFDGCCFFRLNRSRY